MNKFLMAAALFSATSTLYAFDSSHTLWDQALKKYNHHGLVDYQALKLNSNDLNNYLKSLASVPQPEYNSWKKEEKIAFWINAYNVFTWKAIIDHYPIKSSFLKSARYPKNSIRQIKGVWDKLKFSAAGQKLTLNQIEHEILRKKFNEPRIHMALVCAAMACPPLRMEAFKGTQLNDQLEDQSRQFMNNPEKFKIDEAKGIVYLSSIFDWFGKDFIKTYGTDDKYTGKGKKQRAVLNFAHAFLGTDDQKYLDSNQYKVKYLKYDWTLNE